MAATETIERCTVFISSTYEDMKPYREEATRILNRVGAIIKGMEYFGASTETPLDTCIGHVRKSKLFVLIIGMQYGSVEKITGKSFTQLEYEEARKNNIPVLVYIIGKDALVASKYIDIDERATRLRDFKEKLMEDHTVSFFSSPEDFGCKLAQDITDAIDKIASPTETAEVIEKLIKKVQESNNKEIFDVIEKFIQRPFKYSDYEVVLTLKSITDVSYDIKTSLIDAFGLDVGDVASIKAYVLDESHEPICNDARFLVLADGKAADRLEIIRKGVVFKAKCKLAFGTLIETIRTDLITYAEDEAWSALILLEMR